MIGSVPLAASIEVSAGIRYLCGINCSFNNAFPYFTLQRISKLAPPSEFASSTGARVTTEQDGVPSQRGTWKVGGAAAERCPLPVCR